MKTIKFLLTAFIVSAMFASCAKEEMPAVQENQNGDFVGAKLVGTNISVDFGKDSDTKLTGNAWESTDKLGLAWVINNNYNATQDPSAAAALQSGIYANHMFELTESGDFATKGNVYEGWHFAYYPFARDKRLGVNKVVTINPKQTEKWDSDFYNSGLYLSARRFVEEKSVNANNEYVGASWNLHRMYSTVLVTANPSEVFTDDVTMKDLKIKSMKITLDGDTYFVKEATLNADKLPVPVLDKDGLEKLPDTRAAIYGATGLFSNKVWSSFVETVVDNDDINLSGPQVLRAFVMPTSAVKTNNQVKIEIFVEGGKFTVVYKDDEAVDYTAAHGHNNKAIEAVVKAIYNGALSEYKENLSENILRLDLQLTDKMFSADFESISSAEEWNQAVKVANALNLPKSKTVFKVDGEIIVNDNNTLRTPLNGIKEINTVANKGVISIKGEYDIPTAITTALNTDDDVLVNDGATLNVKDNITLNAKVVNSGIINVGYKGKVQTVDNTNGRINVIFGSYLQTATGKDGIIAYEVTGEDSADMINYLMKNDVANKEVTINTLVVNAGITFDLSMVVGAYDNPYDSEDGDGLIPTLLDDMQILMYGGNLIANGGANKLVKNIEVLAGDNTIKNVNAQSLFVKDGKAVVSATASNAGVQEDVKITDIINHSNLVVASDVYTKNFSTPKDAYSLINDGATVRYISTLTQSGKVEGAVEKITGSNPLTIKAVTITDGKQLKKAIQDNKYINLNADLDIPAGDIGTDLSGKVFDGKGHKVSTLNKVADGVGEGVFKVSGPATIKNVDFGAANTQYDVLVSTTGTDAIVIENCNFTQPTNSTMKKGKRALYVPAGYAGTITVNNCKFDDGVYAYNSSATGATFNFNDCDLRGWMSGEGTFNFYNCVFGKSGEYQDYVGYGATSFSGCNFEEGFAISLRKATSYTFDASNKYASKYISTPKDVKWSGNGGDGKAFASRTVSVEIAGTPSTLTAVQTTDLASSFEWE